MSEPRQRCRVNVCVHKPLNAYRYECSAGGKCRMKWKLHRSISEVFLWCVSTHSFINKLLKLSSFNYLSFIILFIIRCIKLQRSAKSWASRSQVGASNLCQCRKNRAYWQAITVSILSEYWRTVCGIEEKTVISVRWGSCHESLLHARMTKIKFYF